MFPRTKAAKRLRADETQYLKALAEGKPACRHTDEILRKAGVSSQASNFIVICGYVALFLSLLFIRNTKVVVFINLVNFLIWFWVWFAAWRRRHDWDKAEKIFPGTNALLINKHENGKFLLSFAGTKYFVIVSAIILVFSLDSFFDEYMIVNLGGYWEIIP